MSKTKVARPVWRRFAPQFFSRAAAWVRSGGQAAIVHDENHIDLLLETDARGELTELGLWSLLALEQRVARKVKEGPAKGLRMARAARHATYAVLDWCERDSAHPGPTRTLKLDCLECGSCCHEANVLLDDDDLDRFRAAGRADLCTTKHVKRSRDGKVRLRFAPDGRCQHLASDLKCRIYALRPYNCSVFPAGSEACLAARESTRKWRDDGATSARKMTVVYTGV
jgi:Fe-S-cluster containining protein